MKNQKKELSQGPGPGVKPGQGAGRPDPDFEAMAKELLRASVLPESVCRRPEHQNQI